MVTVAAVPPVLSVAVTLRLNVPASVGVPLKVAVAVSKVRPAGNVPVRTTEYGAIPPTLANVWLYAAPTAPAGSVAGVRVSVGTATTTV